MCSQKCAMPYMHSGGGNAGPSTAGEPPAALLSLGLLLGVAAGAAGVVVGDSVAATAGAKSSKLGSDPEPTNTFMHAAACVS